MSRKQSIRILFGILFSVTFAVNLQAPLYSEYANQSGVGATGVTIGFAAYVAGLLPTLIFLGGISDIVGRVKPLVIALMLSIFATLLLVLKPDWYSLLIARFVLGIGTALATTAASAYMGELMADSNKTKAALYLTSATSLGFGGGALATGLSLKVEGMTFIPMSFIGFFILSAVLTLCSARLFEAYTKKRTKIVRLPVFPKGTYIYGCAMLIAWATTGMTIAVVPLVLKNINLNEYTGLVIFLAIFVGFLCQPLARKMESTSALKVGLVLSPAGFLIILIGIVNESLVFILLGTAITSSASYGFTYLSSLFQMTNANRTDTARSTAGLFVYAYIGFSLPVIGSGIIADLYGLYTASVVFFLAQLVASAICLVLARRSEVIKSISPSVS